jgi:hypothetical protein
MQPSLRDFRAVALVPTAEAVGYWQLPLRGILVESSQLSPKLFTAKFAKNLRKGH